ncbi:hypothetical protein ACXKU4_002671 [Vibrio cholerae]|uniref:hypothetical protein n=1 Tax=Vibrio cholerae TaxID=666 RepID=UPI0004E42470|nr:hypothetical protein [Vibrio cholerae]EGR2474319.1 hypothetical protein [Vibrio cholerae]EGR4403612.1 hypothetical protein [Vibrio cholerae]ELZ1193164.1 hypothetical protein [Vibrio cholerae]KFD84694.1 hypothetical protein DN41_1527 [Vibrio cholerae]MCX9534798.1 hypothetical protein [Vibrio cholerae]
MGGDSSSSNTTNNNTVNTSGSVGVTGDNAGTIISGVSGSTINNNMTMTDHGAIEGAMDAINNALDAMTSNNNNAFDFAEGALDKVLESNNNTIDKTMDVITSSNNNLKDLAMQAAANGKETLNFASQMMNDALSKVENTMTGGVSGQTNALMKVMMALVIVGGIAATVKAFKGK